MNNQTERNIDEIVTKKKYADMNTKSQMMLEPEFPGYDPKPTQPPERMFIESMKAIPGFTPTAARQSTWAPIIQGVANIADKVIGMGIGGGGSSGSSGGGAPYSGPNFAPTTSISSVDYSFTPKLYGSPWGD
jgi:hypothetical protein